MGEKQEEASVEIIYENGEDDAEEDTKKVYDHLGTAPKMTRTTTAATVSNLDYDHDKEEGEKLEYRKYKETLEEEDEKSESTQKPSLSHYRPPKFVKTTILIEEEDDLSFDKYSASKVYENFIKDAYYPVQQKLQQSRSVIDAGLMEPERDYSHSQDPGRPIRTFARYNDDTHTHYIPKTSPLKDLKEKLSVDDDLSSDPDEHVRCLPSGPNVLYGNRRYYSRYSNEDPDYFDYDLEHSVDLFRKQRTPFLPMKSPKLWEHQLFNDRNHMSGDSTISSHMFTNKGAYPDSRYMNTSYISSALRTPSYWEYRYQNMNGTYKP